jgi:hypothetical protein
MKDDPAKVSDGSHDAMERAAGPDPGGNAVLRTTCVATEIDGGHAPGHAPNTLPQLAAANVIQARRRTILMWIPSSSAVPARGGETDDSQISLVV